MNAYAANILNKHYSSSPAPVSVPQSLRSAVSTPEARPLGQYQLQLRSGPAGDQRPDQGQGILIKICLKIKPYILIGCMHFNHVCKKSFSFLLYTKSVDLSELV